MRAVLLAAGFVAAAAVSTGCGSGGEDDAGAVGGGSGGGERRDGFVDPGEIEVREDGLAYLKGAATAYSGVAVKRDREWRMRSFAHYEDGRRHGPEMRWHAHGRLARVYDWERGEKVRHREWFENGNPEIDAMMRDGVAYGRHLKWHEDGSLRFSGRFLEDLKWDGPMKDIAPDGTVMWDAVFKDGRYVSGIYPEEAEEGLRKAGLLDAEGGKRDEESGE